jgi:DNA-binding transcriptional regulator GbsR (MarR family)
MSLSRISAIFVQYFGQVGGSFGLSRSVAQVFALLYVSNRPLVADEIVETLGFSRSNVSMALKELQSWRLVRLHRRQRDRREYFSAPEDPSQILRIFVEERRRREIEPARAMLRDLLLETPRSDEDRETQARLREMHRLAERLSAMQEEVSKSLFS